MKIGRSNRSRNGAVAASADEQLPVGGKPLVLGAELGPGGGPGVDELVDPLQGGVEPRTGHRLLGYEGDVAAHLPG